MPRLHRELVHELVYEITSGERGEGESLPRETDLAERFDVSRGVARESMRALEERGLIRVKHGRGATVRPASEWNLFDGEVMAGMLAGPGADAALSGALECLRILEPEAAALAAERASPEDLQELSQAIERMGEAQRVTEGNALAGSDARAAELAFHRALMRATHNLSIARIGEPLHEALAAARWRQREPRAGRVLSKNHYEDIFQAVAGGDANAARSRMRRCLDALARELDHPGGASPT